MIVLYSVWHMKIGATCFSLSKVSLSKSSSQNLCLKKTLITLNFVSQQYMSFFDGESHTDHRVELFFYANGRFPLFS